MRAGSPWRPALLAGAVAAGLVSLPDRAGPSQQARPPRALERVAPVLPDSVAGLRLSGWVLVWATIDSAGRVVEAESRDHVSADYCFGPHAPVFERAAVAAVRGYRMGPGHGESSPAGTVVIPIPFHTPPVEGGGPTGALVGMVTDASDRQPLIRAGVCAREARLATLALAYQGYRLEGLPVGRQSIVMSANGYASARRTVVIRPGTTDTLDLRLERCAECRLSRCFDIPRRAAP
ncbi:MAG: carboxypeptidase regulatory-like domain-containing protein [Candidatus Eiseniibacteriota bacterium]